jgi:hypothetical protein
MGLVLAPVGNPFTNYGKDLSIRTNPYSIGLIVNNS